MSRSETSAFVTEMWARVSLQQTCSPAGYRLSELLLTCPELVSRSSVLAPLMLTANLGSSAYCDPHVADENNESQRGWEARLSDRK